MIVWSDDVPSPEEYVALRAGAGLGPRSLDAARLGLAANLHGTVAQDGAQLVAMGRVVGDGGCFALLCDIAVAPARHGQGLGREATLPPDCHLSLVSSARAVLLYQAHGFRPTCGMDRYADPDPHAPAVTDWITAIEGTPAGHDAALWLALAAAFLHALFGALQKGARYDPWTSRTAMDGAIFCIATPVALFAVPWPPASMWWVLVGMVAIQTTYKALQGATYARGAYTVVYPVVRGTAPLFTVLGAGAIFGERFSAGQWAGVALLLAGLFGLSAYNMAKVTEGRASLVPALRLAVTTGLMVAVYTTWNAYGIRETPNPFTYLAWFFMLSSWDFPLVALLRGKGRWPEPALMRLGLAGAVVAFGSFGSIMLATRLDSVGQAAILRETSTVFAALIGWLVLKEAVGPRRLALMSLIALGAVVVEFGG